MRIMLKFKDDHGYNQETMIQSMQDAITFHGGTMHHAANIYHAIAADGSVVIDVNTGLNEKALAGKYEQKFIAYKYAHETNPTRMNEIERERFLVWNKMLRTDVMYVMRDAVAEMKRNAWRLACQIEVPKRFEVMELIDVLTRQIDYSKDYGDKLSTDAQIQLDLMLS